MHDCRYLMPRARVNVAVLLHTFGGRCTASPAVGRPADGVKRSGIRAVAAAPNGTTERQHRITGDALAEAALIGVSAAVLLVTVLAVDRVLSR
jgi:hypothetical protein